MKNFSSSVWKVGLSTLSILLSTTIPLGFTEPAQALCATDELGGQWENVDPNTRGITKINYIPRCGDQRFCSTDGTCSEPARTSIQVFGACSPTDCDWGESPMRIYQSDDWRYSVYEQGFARKVVWYRLNSDDQLVVAEQVDYRDSREDRTSWYRFDRVED
ncbi:hypothetical protein [cf. Phormidesmis sp. LEGE 11477]|uniref:hypothetical protein n=1 Tax=cf. Phormidesmis sp. LEGE 11477 TaxID=1828680 RepID=UPI001882756B|nr:hypothetical protein [cf. Phormidesmis sp. LEGE 11477]MBE9063346.1 hypothetical protein [cf. Phormidesmis sp. LEGE 11477]